MPKPYPTSPLPAPPGTPRRRSRAITLVEVVISLTVFAIIILGTISVLIFGLRTIDQSRCTAQVTQIIMNEMEAMRMRKWEDRSPANGDLYLLYGIKTLGTAPASTFGSSNAEIPNGTTTGSFFFAPFAYYANEIRNPPERIKYKLLFAYDAANPTDPANPAKLTRTVKLFKSATNPDAGEDFAVITITVEWTDRNGQKHSRSAQTTMSKNGLNDSISG